MHIAPDVRGQNEIQVLWSKQRLKLYLDAAHRSHDGRVIARNILDFARFFFFFDSFRLRQGGFGALLLFCQFLSALFANPRFFQPQYVGRDIWIESELSAHVGVDDVWSTLIAIFCADITNFGADHCLGARAPAAIMTRSLHFGDRYHRRAATLVFDFSMGGTQLVAGKQVIWSSDLDHVLHLLSLTNVLGYEQSHYNGSITFERVGRGSNFNTLSDDGTELHLTQDIIAKFLQLHRRHVNLR